VRVPGEAGLIEMLREMGIAWATCWAPYWLSAGNSNRIELPGKVRVVVEIGAASLPRSRHLQSGRYSGNSSSTTTMQYVMCCPILTLAGVRCLS